MLRARWALLLLCFQALFSALLAKKGKQHEGTGRRSHHPSKQHRSIAVPSEIHELASLADGFLWRITVVQSGLHLYTDSGAVVTTHRSFSLFAVSLGEGGAHYFEAFAEGDGTRRLAPLSLRDGDSSRLLAVSPPVKPHIWRNKEKRKKKDKLPPAPVTPPAPSPLPPPSPPRERLPLYLERQSDGSYALLLAANGSSHLAENTAHRVTSSAVPWVAGEGCTYHFARIAPREVESGGQRSSAGFQKWSLTNRIRQSTARVGDTKVVVMSALALPFVDQAPLSWQWLEANGINGLLLLSTDSQICDAALTLHRAQPNATLWVSCVLPEDLALPQSGATSEWSMQKPMVYETAANMPDAKFLGRCKMRLLELILAKGLAVAYIDSTVLVLSPHYLASLVRLNTDLAIGSTRQTGYGDANIGTCVQIPPQYALWVSDWFSSAKLFLRASAAATWLLREAQQLMDEHELPDVDALQVVLTGHAQVSDPLRTQRRKEGAAIAAAAGSGGAVERKAGATWLKPLWLELDYDPYKGDRLISHKWLRPLNAPLSVRGWRRLRHEVRAQDLKWTVIPEQLHLEDARSVQANWSTMLGRGLGSMRIDGTRNGKFLSMEVNCHTKRELSAVQARGSFLFRPEPPEVTWEKFETDFPDEARSFRECGKSKCGGGGGGGGSGGSSGKGKRGKGGKGGLKQRKKLKFRLRIGKSNS